MNKKETLELYKNELKSICGDYEELISFLTFCQSFNKKDYSSMNKAIIRYFFPQSLYVNTMKQWNKAGYKVKKGSKSTCLLAPNFKKVEKRNDKGEKIPDEYDSVLTGFSCFYVFDASQVEDKEGNPFIPESYQFDPLFEVDEDLNDAIETLGGNAEHNEGYQNLHTLFGSNLEGAIAEYIVASQLCIPVEDAVKRIKDRMSKDYATVKSALKAGEKIAKTIYANLEDLAFA